jgi:hypothetical protein
MPTGLPRRNHLAAKQSVASIAFNTLLVASAVLLAIVVVVREESYALGQGQPAPTELAAPNELADGAAPLQPE